MKKKSKETQYFFILKGHEVTTSAQTKVNIFIELNILSLSISTR